MQSLSDKKAGENVESNPRKIPNEGMPEMHTDGPDLSWFEFMPAWVMYTPVVIQSLFLAVRFRSLTLPLAANPGIHLSGMVGESKTAILSLAGRKAKKYILPFVTVNRQSDSSKDALSRSKARLSELGLQYPVVAKPDMGCRGLVYALSIPMTISIDT